MYRADGRLYLAGLFAPFKGTFFVFFKPSNGELIARKIEEVFIDKCWTFFTRISRLKTVVYGSLATSYDRHFAIDLRPGCSMQLVYPKKRR